MVHEPWVARRAGRAAHVIVEGAVPTDVARREAERLGATAAIVGSLPFVYDAVVLAIGKAGGPLAWAAGVAAGFWNYAKSQEGGGGLVPAGLVATLGGILFSYGIMLSAFAAASEIRPEL